MLPNHSPLVIAEQFGTLETLYPGRIDLGVGRAPGTDGLTARALRRHLSGADDDFPRQLSELLAYLAPAGPGQRLQAVPGAGTNVPVWLLGSSTFSAQLAAQLGLPFAFASHFAPELLFEAIDLYRSGFQPSRYLDRPYVMAGAPVVAAESDDEANRLATSLALRFLKLIRGQQIFATPPVDSMEDLWNDAERQVVQSKLGVAIVGGPETLRRKFREFFEATRADEVILTSDVYEHPARLRSFEIAAATLKELPVS
jgi:luciferase family oxidoreductase group 1